MTLQISLSDLRTQAQQLADLLTIAQNRHEPDERYRDFLGKQIARLHEALRDAATPESYRVAVVGSFKVGKSSFVNALCDVTRLVSVATNPETAAVTTLRYSERPYAEIYMITQGAWQIMRQAHANDPNDPAAVRYAAILKKEKDGDLVLPAKEGKAKLRTSIKALEDRFLSDEGKVEVVNCDDWTSQKTRIDFGRHISAYTSQSSPAHFFVDRLEVFVPVPFLREGIELVDTPGLDDPDRYRVRITEKLVEDVDAILFLTQSGRAYSQQDKDFIITQLRKSKLKHLMLVVTRCDETYSNACKDAEELGDDPPTFEEHLKREEQRLVGHIRATLDELLSTPKLNDELGEFYLRQLLDIKVHFTSADYYSEAKKAKDPTVAHEKLVQSGIDHLRKDLAVVLAQSERILRAKRSLADAIDHVSERTFRTFVARRDSVASEFNIERVRAQLAQIDTDLISNFTGFATRMQEQVHLFCAQNQANQVLAQAQIQLAVSQAQDIITREFEMTDIGRHWKTRRNHGWGMLSDIQHKIANRIFPQVEQALRSYATRFHTMLSRTRTDLERFEVTVSEIEATTGLEKELQPLGLTSVFDQSYQQKLNALEALVSLQRNGIISRLDDFISAEVGDNIDAARERVAAEWGRGTTVRQNTHIHDFYAFLHRELHRELEAYLRTALEKFVATLEQNADLIYPDLKHVINQTIEDHRKAIESNLAERNEHQKAVLLNALHNVLDGLKQFQRQPVVMA